MARHSRMLAAFVFIACAGVAFAQSPQTGNVTGDTGIVAADPSVIQTNDGIVAVESRNGQGLFVRVASALSELGDAQPISVWSDRAGLGEVWAPEIVFRDGRYEIYFAAGEGRDHRMYSIDSAEPSTGYGHTRKIELPDDKWAIDGMPFTFGGISYFVWSGWQGNHNVRQQLYIARMGPDGVVEAPRVSIGTVDRRWENVAGELPGINEGPQPIVDPASQLHVVYSANGSWGENYCMADLRLRADGDPLDTAAWSESQGCLFGANAATLAEDATLATQAKGVGHHSFMLPQGDIEASEHQSDPMPFLYHGVPAGEDPDNFWEARKWFIGSYEWQPELAYRSKAGPDIGWGLKFSEQ